MREIQSLSNCEPVADTIMGPCVLSVLATLVHICSGARMYMYMCSCSTNLWRSRNVRTSRYKSLLSFELIMLEYDRGSDKSCKILESSRGGNLLRKCWAILEMFVSSACDDTMYMFLVLTFWIMRACPHVYR
jgi:hypothetical protein